MSDYTHDQALVDEIEKTQAMLNVSVLSARLAGLTVILSVNDELGDGETTVSSLVVRPIRGTK